MIDEEKTILKLGEGSYRRKDAPKPKDWRSHFFVLHSKTSKIKIYGEGRGKTTLDGFGLSTACEIMNVEIHDLRIRNAPWSGIDSSNMSLIMRNCTIENCYVGIQSYECGAREIFLESLQVFNCSNEDGSPGAIMGIDGSGEVSACTITLSGEHTRIQGNGKNPIYAIATLRIVRPLTKEILSTNTSVAEFFGGCLIHEVGNDGVVLDVFDYATDNNAEEEDEQVNDTSSAKILKQMNATIDFKFIEMMEMMNSLNKKIDGYFN